MSNVNALFWRDYFCDKTHYFDVYQWILQQDPLFRFSLNTHLVYELSISLNSPIVIGCLQRAAIDCAKMMTINSS